MLQKLVREFDRLGVLWVALIFAAVGLNAVYIAPALIATWGSWGGGLINDEIIRGNDFIAFWSAAQFAWEGRGVVAYDVTAFQAYQADLTASPGWNVMPWLYPPTGFLLVMPFGALPYFPGLALWQALPLIGFMVIMAGMALPRLLYWLLPLSAAAVQTVVAGQNGLISAMLLAGGLLGLERHPRLAGVFFGLMTFKPQLAVLIPPVLLVSRQWSALMAMAATVAVLSGLSLALFGVAPWIAFVQNLNYTSEQMALGNLPEARMPTVLAAVLTIGLGIEVGKVLYVLVAMGAVVGLLWGWYRPLPFALKAALLAATIPLASPYAFDYDLAVLLVALAWLIQDHARAPIGSTEKLAMFLAWALPAWWVTSLVLESGFAFGALILLIFYAAILRRCWRAVVAQ